MAEARPLFDDEEVTKNSQPGAALDLSANLVAKPLDLSEPSPVILPLEFNEPPAGKPSALNFPEKPVIQALVLPEVISPAPKQAPRVAALELPETPDKPKPQISILDLSDLPEPATKPRTDLKTVSTEVMPSDPFATEEHPSIAPAMRRGQEKFPDIMKASSHQIRNNLNAIVPITYESVSDYASQTLERAAGLVDKISAATRAVHDVNVEAQIKSILERADNTKNKSSLLGMIGSSLRPFDATAAHAQLTAIKEALRVRLKAVADLHDEMIRIRDTLAIQVTTLAILADMTDHGDVGGMIVRKGNTLQVSLQEVQMSLTQVANIQKNAQEWAMRCDEVKYNTLPALGFRASM